MKFDLHLREDLGRRVRAVAAKMAEWQHRTRLSRADEDRIRAAIRTFPHTTAAGDFLVGGVDGSGDFPALSYADSFVYFAVAHAALYRTDPSCGLREIPPGFDPVVELSWLPEDNDEAAKSWKASFRSLSGLPLQEVICRSDYRELKANATGKVQNVGALQTSLLRPKASDTGNVGIQLRSTAELGAALRLLESPNQPDIVLLEGTLSLPLVTRHEASLFLEHLKRLCCTVARDRRIALVAFSKSHSLPGVEEIERLAGEALGLEPGTLPEHWFLRIPSAREGWTLPLVDGRRLPPDGAVTYLARFHCTTPILRIDFDARFWSDVVQEQTEEKRLFSRLDYCSHDQRSFGYPYPLKAGHDRTLLTPQEKIALRNQVIDEAVRAGMSRRLFRQSSVATRYK